jgi:rare lipoprotein A (peptidoglycan hydrolase)
MIREPSPGIASHFDDTIASTGERLRQYDPDPERFVCASPSEPLGTVLRVCAVATGLCIRCRIGDIGPDPKLKRAIDLPPSAFVALGLRLVDGLAYVSFERE